VLEIHLDLGGYPVTVLDTAGIRDTTDPIEREGVRRAASKRWRGPRPLGDRSEVRGCRRGARRSQLVGGQQDGSGGSRTASKIESIFKKSSEVHFISSTTGMGVEQLVTSISGFAERFFTQERLL
jgi:tRNA modification GTPase